MTGADAETRGPDRDTIRDLWEVMTGMFGEVWTRQFGVVDDGDVWLHGLRGLDADAIAHGVEVVMSSGLRYPPSLPAFRRMCLGVPSIERARALLFDGSDFSRLLWSYIDSWAYDRATEEVADRMVRAAYVEAVRHLDGGGSPPEPPAASLIHLPPLRDPNAPRMSAADAISRARAILGSGS